MAPKVERRNGGVERTVVIGCVVSRAVLGPIATRWEPGLFPSRWAALVVGWCVTHYNKYRRAPGRDITGYFDAWAETNRDPETTAIVESLLRGLSEEYEHLKKTTSPDYILDSAGVLFERARLADLTLRVSAFLEDGHIDKARAAVDASRRVEIGLGAGINVLSDGPAFDAVFATRGSALIEYPDALANFFVPDVMQRDSFIAFMGKEKVGKSYWLQDMAWRAVTQNRKVAYFEVGDSSQPQVLSRFARRIMERPLAAGRYNYPLEIESSGSKKLPTLKTELMRFRDDVTPAELHVERERVMGLYGSDTFKLSCHPNSSISVSGIGAVLETWERDGFSPDVVIVDYADILAPMDNRAETRDQINATWKALRGLSQRLHCMVVTATQTDADSYDTWLLSRKNFSEDKRKYAHVNGMIGINQMAPEKELGLYRLNWVAAREFEYAESKFVWTAGSLAYANPAMLSVF